MKPCLVWLLLLAFAVPAMAQDPTPAPPTPAVSVTVHPDVLAALARIEARQAIMLPQLTRIEEKAGTWESLGRWLTKPETLTAIITAVATAYTTIKVKH